MTVARLINLWLADRLPKGVRLFFVSIKKSPYGDFVVDYPHGPPTNKVGNSIPQEIELKPYRIQDKIVVAGFNSSSGCFAVGRDRWTDSPFYDTSDPQEARNEQTNISN